MSSEGSVGASSAWPGSGYHAMLRKYKSNLNVSNHSKRSKIKNFRSIIGIGGKRTGWKGPNSLKRDSLGLIDVNEYFAKELSPHLSDDNSRSSVIHSKDSLPRTSHRKKKEDPVVHRTLKQFSPETQSEKTTSINFTSSHTRLNEFPYAHHDNSDLSVQYSRQAFTKFDLSPVFLTPPNRITGFPVPSYNASSNAIPQPTSPANINNDKVNKPIEECPLFVALNNNDLTLSKSISFYEKLENSLLINKNLFNVKNNISSHTPLTREIVYDARNVDSNIRREKHNGLYTINKYPTSPTTSNTNFSLKSLIKEVKNPFGFNKLDNKHLQGDNLDDDNTSDFSLFSGMKFIKDQTPYSSTVRNFGSIVNNNLSPSTSDDYNVDVLLNSSHVSSSTGNISIEESADIHFDSISSSDEDKDEISLMQYTPKVAFSGTGITISSEVSSMSYQATSTSDIGNVLPQVSSEKSPISPLIDDDLQTLKSSSFLTDSTIHPENLPTTSIISPEKSFALSITSPVELVMSDLSGYRSEISPISSPNDGPVPDIYYPTLNENEDNIHTRQPSPSLLSDNVNQYNLNDSIPPSPEFPSHEYADDRFQVTLGQRVFEADTLNVLQSHSSPQTSPVSRESSDINSTKHSLNASLVQVPESVQDYVGYCQVQSQKISDESSSKSPFVPTHAHGVDLSQQQSPKIIQKLSIRHSFKDSLTDSLTHFTKISQNPSPKIPPILVSRDALDPVDTKKYDVCNDTQVQNIYSMNSPPLMDEKATEYHKSPQLERFMDQDMMPLGEKNDISILPSGINATVDIATPVLENTIPELPNNHEHVLNENVIEIDSVLQEEIREDINHQVEIFEFYDSNVPVIENGLERSQSVDDKNLPIIDISSIPATTPYRDLPLPLQESTSNKTLQDTSPQLTQPSAVVADAPTSGMLMGAAPKRKRGRPRKHPLDPSALTAMVTPAQSCAPSSHYMGQNNDANKARKKGKFTELPQFVLESGTENREGTRRSLRMRIGRLRFWEGERVVLGRNENGFCPVPVVKKIIRLDNKEIADLKSDKINLSDGRLRHNRLKRPHIIPKPATVFNIVTGKEDKQHIVATPDMLNPRTVGIGDYKFQKIFSEGKFFASGMLVMPKGSEKPNKNSNRSAMFPAKSKSRYTKTNSSYAQGLSFSSREIYQALFQEGVMVAEKRIGNYNHPSVDVRNIYVIKILQSLESQGYVTSNFSWGHYYYTLNSEGIDHLKIELNLPAEIVPRTFIKQVTIAQDSGSRYRGSGGYDGDRGSRPGGEHHRPNRTDYNNYGHGDRSSSWRKDYRGEGVGRGTPVQ